MRVCVITPGFASDEHDECIPALRDFVLALSQGHQVTVVALRYPHHTEPYRIGAVDVLPIGAKQSAGLGRLRLLAKAKNTIEKAGPFDVFHGFWADEPGWLAQHCASKAKAVSIVSLMGGEFAEFKTQGYGGMLSLANRVLQRRAISRATLVTAGSKWLQKLASGQARRQVSLLPLGVALPQDAVTARSHLKAPLRIAAIGSMVAIKGFDSLIEGCAKAHDQGVDLHLSMFGDGPLRTNLEKLATARNVPTKWFGHLPRREVLRRLGEIDLVLQGSLWESQGMAIVEAAWAGCAVAGTQVGTLDELEHRYGEFAPMNTEQIATLIEGASLDPQGLIDSGRALQLEVAKSHSMAKALEQWETVIAAAGSI